jgi:polar amino acid transport system substrate-binding protein
MTIARRRWLNLAAVALTGALLSACSPKAPESPAKAAAAPAPAPAPAKVYVVGIDAAYAPFESQNEKGEIVGFSVDLMRALAAKAGMEVKFVNTPWEGIFNALAQGDRDLLISSIGITPERRQTIDFSDPYFDAHQLIVVREKSKVTKFDDLKKLKVGVQTGTTGDEAVSKLLGKNNTNIKRFELWPLALKELESGGVDAVVADNGVIVYYVANNENSGFRMVNDPAFTPEQYGIAVRKGNAELLAKVNQALAALKADGSYDALYARYFGANAEPAKPDAPKPDDAKKPKKGGC